MTFTRSLKLIGKGDFYIAGGKGALLGELTQSGFPVPPGFVILTPSFSYFLDSAGLTPKITSLLSSLDTNDTSALWSTSDRLRALVLSGTFPSDLAAAISNAYTALGASSVAVRSSAPFEDSASASWAGQLDSFLNVTFETLIQSITNCWAALFSPRALLYRDSLQSQGDSPEMAVVVQEMVPAVASGVAFSRYEDAWILIEAGSGLGDAVVAGRVTPQQYLVHRRSRTLGERDLLRRGKSDSALRDGPDSLPSEPPLLSHAELLLLADLIMKVESHLGYPVDLEWAFVDGRVFVLQARPITAILDARIASQARLAIPPLRESDFHIQFRVRGLPLLLADILMSRYRELSHVFALDHNVFTQYAWKESTRLALEEGVDLYGDSARFQRYLDEFNTAVEDSRKAFESIIGDRDLDRGSVGAFCQHARRLIWLYSQMDPIYTDEAFRRSEADGALANNLAKLAQVKDSFRDFINRVLLGDDSYLAVLLRGLARRLKISKADDLYWFSVQELEALFENPTANEEDLVTRRSAYVLIGSPERTSYLYGTEASSFLAKFVSSLPRDYRDELRGDVASRGGGNITGQVRLIRVDYGSVIEMQQQMQAMRPGEILVAETTAPELIAACRKAAAIVTDIGGLLSHAAIVSRELRIPCIVGTEVATEILATGDVVEVDVERGAVRLIAKGEH